MKNAMSKLADSAQFQKTRVNTASPLVEKHRVIDSSWSVMAHGIARDGEMKGKLANGVGSQYSSHYLRTWCIQHYYHRCAHLGCQQSTEMTPPPI